MDGKIEKFCANVDGSVVAHLADGRDFHSVDGENWRELHEPPPSAYRSVAYGSGGICPRLHA